jgi:hypothetical protein
MAGFPLHGQLHGWYSKLLRVFGVNFSLHSCSVNYIYK